MSTTTSSLVEEKFNSNVVKRIHREVRFGNYILGSTLGEGEFGKVKLGWRKDGKLPNQVAIKLIKRDTLAKDQESEIKIHREINSLKLLNHPNIVNLVEVMKSGKYIGIVLEYASGGELFDYILNHKYLKEPLAKKFFAQLVSGVDYMHSKGLIHRDLKLENLLLDKNKNIIISDFGFVNSYNLNNSNDFMKTSCGSPCYAAPELVLTPSPYQGKKVDIWSLGIILYAMLAGYLPFDDDPTNEDGADIIKLYHYICKTPLTFPEYINPLPRDLLRKIIVSDPKKRISISEIRNHPWLSSYASLLSIRQPEWDKIYKDKQLRVPSNPSSTSSSSRSNNASKRFSMINEPTNSSQLTSNNFKKQHGRSSSTSSQVYMGENMFNGKISTIVELPKRPPLSVIDNSVSPVSQGQSPIDTGGDANDHELPLLQASSPHKDVQPQKIHTTIPIPIAVSTSENITNDSSIPSKPITKLPHQQRKPRPTSYHPSNSYSYSSSSIDFKSPSPINIPMQQFLNTSPRNSPPKSNSPTKSEIESLDSRRNSVVTPINVNGVLTRENSQRNSALFYLEDKMNNLELTNSTTLRHDSVASNSNNQPVLNENQHLPIEKPIPVPITKTPTQISIEKRKEKEQKRRNRFSLLSIYSYDSRPPSPKSKRKSEIIMGTSGTATIDKRSKEVSAAKKVMDFFKRRSVRVN